MLLALLLALSTSAPLIETHESAAIPAPRNGITVEFDSQEPYVDLEGSVLYYVGAINELGLRKVRSRLAAAGSRPRYLMVDSSGGDLIVGAKLAEAIHVNEMHVVVFRKGCSSSCANYLFVPAARKTILPGALVVWHGSCPRNLPGDPEAVLRAYDQGTLKLEISGGDEVPGNHDGRQVIVEQWEKFRKYRENLGREHDRVYLGTRIDDRITCLAADVFRVPYEMYTMGINEMAWFGVCDVDAPSDYIDTARRIFRKQVPANFGVIEPYMVQDLKPKDGVAKCGMRNR